MDAGLNGLEGLGFIVMVIGINNRINRLIVSYRWLVIPLEKRKENKKGLQWILGMDKKKFDLLILEGVKLWGILRKFGCVVYFWREMRAH